jgi:prophage regulatory protein
MNRVPKPARVARHPRTLEDRMTSSLRILRLPEVMRRTGLRRDSIYRLGHDGAFPRPVKISERATGWIEAEVDAFVEQRIAARDAAGS